METTKALRRVRLITPMMREDVGTAVLSNVVMQAANNTIPKGLKGTYTDFVPIEDAWLAPLHLCGRAPSPQSLYRHRPVVG
jgi:hypothetical protein